MKDRGAAIFALLFIGGCDQADVAPEASIASEVRLHITAAYDPSLLESNVALELRNDSSFPICFSQGDLDPSYGSTIVRDAQGEPLGATSIGPYFELRGVNVAAPIIVTRPGETRNEMLDLKDFRPNRRPLVLQVRLEAFRCSDLFDESVDEVRRTPVEQVFRVEGGRIAEQPGLRFPDTEPPSNSADASPIG